MRKFLIAFGIFLSVILIYGSIYPNPRNWYDHYKYLAQSFLKGKVDVSDLPQFYHDKIIFNAKTYLPFPPLPALVLTPIVFLCPSLTQQQVSIFIGAINTVLLFFLLSKFTNTKNSALLTVFFAFGTVAFWAAVVGTVWYFAHTVAIFFFLLSLIAFKSEKDFLAGAFFSLAVLSRLPIFGGIIFFILALRQQKKRLKIFLLTALLCLPLELFYNFLRFGNIFKTGYLEVYKNYIGMGYPFTLLQLIKPSFPYFGYLDPRNIPLHLFTFLLMPPVIKTGSLIPSPYGLGIIFISPLLLVALKPNLKDRLQKNLFLAAGAIALVDFLHYAQGWVQLGYRFLLDFLPFLILILALKFRPTKLNLFLLTVSILLNFWGVKWAIKLGW